MVGRISTKNVAFSSTNCCLASVYSLTRMQIDKKIVPDFGKILNNTLQLKSNVFRAQKFGFHFLFKLYFSIYCQNILSLSNIADIIWLLCLWQKHFCKCCKLHPGKSYWRGGLSTVDLLLLTNLDQPFLYWKCYLPYVQIKLP